MHEQVKIIKMSDIENFEDTLNEQLETVLNFIDWRILTIKNEECLVITYRK